MYEVYANKQQPIGHAESPDTTQGFTQTPKINEPIDVKNLLGTGLIASQVIPAGRQIIDTVINSRGNINLKRNVNRLKNLITYGSIAAFTGGLPIAVGTFLATTIVETSSTAVENYYDTINQNYEVQKKGAAIEKFAGIGAYYD